MADKYFQILDERSGFARYRAAAETGGPWSSDLQHGGPPSALLVHCAQRLAAEETGRADLVALRLAAEFVGPVPVGDVDVQARVVRAARSAVLVAAHISVGERECLHGRVWLARTADTSAVAAPLPEAVPPPDDLPGLGATFPYGDSIEWRAVSGSISTPGPGIVWARPRLALIDGHVLSGLALVSLVGDSASGISSALDWSTWSFLNVDLDVHLARPVQGEWVCLDAATQLGPSGSALARSTVSDARGVVGCTAQTLLLTPHR